MEIKGISKLSLSYNRGFPWKSRRNITYKGYFLPTEKVKNEDSVIELLSQVNTFDEFIEVLDLVDGCFAIVIQNETEILIAVDRIRTFPIFFDAQGQFVSDKAETIRLNLKIDNKAVDPLLMNELRIKRNTKSGHTVYAEILQLEPGQAVSIKSEGVFSRFYYRHLQRGVINKETDLDLQFDDILNQTFSDVLSTISEKKIIVPLSGGYDSRLIVSMLKKNNISNVLCYTYGREEDYEVKNSKRVAAALGYDWIFVAYTNEEWTNFLNENNKDAEMYFEDAHNHCVFPHLQEYIALKKLSEMGKIHSGDVVIPGFCGDVHAGSYTDLPATENYDADYLVEYTFKTHYINLKYNKKIESQLKLSLLDYYNNLGYEIIDRNSAICAYQEWVVSGRLSMWVVNSVRVYEHFGLEFRLPQWERKYIDFWYSIDNVFRDKCRFYRKYLLNGIFKEYGIDLKKPSPSILHNNVIKSKIASFVRYWLIFFSVHAGKDYYHRNNINNYNYGAILLYKKLKNKKLFKYNSLSIHSMEALWWCERKYF